MNLFRIMTSCLGRLPGSKGLLPVLLALVLIAGQTAALGHSHADHKLAVDCELCLQLANVIPTSHKLSSTAVLDNYISLQGADSPLLILRAANARGPPSFLS